MVCKEEVAHWFKDLESYKRVDTLCTLLHMCLPFELRFAGTCVEELAGHFSKEFRGIEVRVNSGELAQDIQSSQLSDPADIKVRRKWVLYFALIRGCNRPCAGDLFNILDSWRLNDFLKQAKDEALQELLLVFMMAANHPVFSFEQRYKCGEIYNMILHGKWDTLCTEVPTADGMSESNYSVQNPSTSNDQSRGSQIENISTHPVYAENVQPAQGVYQQNVAHSYPSQVSNVTSSARKNLQATAQPPSTHQNPQQTPAVQHIKSSNTTNLSYSMQNLNLDSNNIVFDTDGIPIMRKSESGSASSIESVDDSTPPGTPHTSSGVSSSSSFKKHRVRSDSKSSTSSSNRHSQVSMAVQSQPQTHLVFGAGQMIPPIPVSVPISGDIVHAPNVVTSAAAIPGFSIANQAVILQPQGYGAAPQLHKSQMTTAYQYHTQAIPMAANRVLTTYAPTQGQPAPQQAAATFRVPRLVPGNMARPKQKHDKSSQTQMISSVSMSFKPRSTSTYLQPNGEVIHYPYPSTIAYTQSQPLPQPMPQRQPSTSNQTPQHLPTITSLSSKSNPANVLQSFVLDPNTKPGVSCFNCGSSTHVGQDCPDSTMEEINRHYKLDYNSDKTAGELIDNGNSSVRGNSDAITHIAPTVLNK